MGIFDQIESISPLGGEVSFALLSRFTGSAWSLSQLGSYNGSFLSSADSQSVLQFCSRFTVSFVEQAFHSVNFTGSARRRHLAQCLLLSRTSVVKTTINFDSNTRTFQFESCNFLTSSFGQSWHCLDFVMFTGEELVINGCLNILSHLSFLSQYVVVSQFTMTQFDIKDFSTTAPIFSGMIISEKTFGDCPLSSFTFDIYLGTSWTQSTAQI